MTLPIITFDPKRDLVLEREIDVPVEFVWRAWTTPEHLSQWFAPKPWSITACSIDLRPGGALNFTMRSPEGDEHPNTQCYLEVTPFQRLVTTDTLIGGYRPSANPFFTAVLDMTQKGDGTLYRATAIHGDEASRKKHEEMGFHEGWGTVLTQMVEYIKARMQH
jgi:uncharacterized protein YndB with AHSA1/START domain